MPESPFSVTGIPNPSRRYTKVGRCIYCGTIHTEADDALEQEHIIPLAFGGALLLPQASCRNCATITSRIETACFRGMLSTARDHMRIVGRQKVKKRDRLPVQITGSNRTHSVPVSQHPSALIQLHLPMPRLALLMPPEPVTDLAGRVVIVPMTPDIGVRASRISNDVTLTPGLLASDVYRLIAKIGHAFATAELGHGTFQPLLLGTIFCPHPLYADSYVGTEWFSEPKMSTLHAVSFGSPVLFRNQELIVVRIRLFAHIAGTVTYLAIAGSRAPIVCAGSRSDGSEPS